jgi:hypothetical protein
MTAAVEFAETVASASVRAGAANDSYDRPGVVGVFS